MSLNQALLTAVTGLRAAQTGLSVVSSNVANAETPGYVRKTAVQVPTSAGDFAVGVNVIAVKRQLDQFVQRQLRVESSGANYADLRAQFYDRLQGIYGAPGSPAALETVFNNLTSALQALSTSPDSASARSAVLSSAQVLTQQLNGMTADIQGMRSDAELAIADAVQSANDAMARIAAINKQLGTTSTSDTATATLLDQRDQAIDDLAQLMDINVVPGDHNQVSIFTNSGIQLVGLQASKLGFDPQGAVTANAQWSADPSTRTVGTIVLEGHGDTDLIATNAIRSGKIAALVEMRDKVLVQAQTQLDAFAAGLASALSDATVDGTAVTGPSSGFDIDLAGLLNGNSVRISYTDNTTHTPRTVTLVRVDDPSALPLANTAAIDPNDQVVGVDFSGGFLSILNQLNTALGQTQLQFSSPGGMTLRVLDDGATNRIDVTSVSATKTVTSLTGGTPQLAFFMDGTNPYTGALSSTGSQMAGFAGRIAINPSLLSDSSKLVVYQTSPLTPAGDATRPNFILSQLTSTPSAFAPQTGIGTAATPFSGSLDEFLRQVVSHQGDAAQSAESLKQGQDVVYNSLQQRFNDSAGVNIDEEMANLLSLQNSYAANARVMSAVKDMLDALFQI